MSRAFGVAAEWLEEARELGEEIFQLLDVLDEEEIAEAMESGEWETGSW